MQVKGKKTIVSECKGCIRATALSLAVCQDERRCHDPEDAIPVYHKIPSLFENDNCNGL